MGYKTQYMISQGEYSDYGVVAAFEDEDTAKLWLEAMVEDKKYPEYRIEEQVLVTEGTKPTKITLFHKTAELVDKDHQVLHVRDYQHTDWACESEYRFTRPKVRYVRAPCHDGKAGRLEVISKSAAQTDKVFNDKVMAWKAGSFGGPGYDEIKEGFPRDEE